MNMADQKDLLSLARDRMRACVDAESMGRSDALDDLRFLLGGRNQWPAQAAQQRDLEGRPCMTFNQLPAILQQVTNDQRQNTPGIKVHPVDSGADVETAEVLQGLIRHIEYSSDADAAYDTAVNAAAACGFGVWRLLTEYEAPDSFDQVIKFSRVRNSLSVYIDPFAQCPVASDMRYCFITDLVPKEQFKREYPNAKVTDGVEWQGIGDTYKQGWVRDAGIIVAEYYWIELVADTLVLLQDGSTAWKSELGKDADVVSAKTRPSMRRTVRWAKITGADVLEEAVIPGSWIPVFPVYGQELDIEGQVHRWGVVRNAKDPARMYNFWMTSATEEVAMRPKTPYIGAEGQFEGFEQQWANAGKTNSAYLEYKPVSLAGQLAPPPQRQPMADVPVGVLQMAMHARDNLKSTTGLYDASLGAQGNETSGRAILARQKEGDTANYHFVDNLNRAIKHCGRVMVEMIPHIYDGERVVRIRGEDEEISSARINTTEAGADGAARVLNDLTVGKYDVTITAGPSYTTQRQEAAEAMTQFAQSWPKLMDVAGDKVVANMDWPGAEEIAERIKKTIPPGLADDGEGDEPQVPPEVQQQIQQMDQAIQGLTQELEQAQSGLEKARIDAESRERVAEINAQAKLDTEELKGMVSMLLARMQPPPALVDMALSTGAPPSQPPRPPSAAPPQDMPEPEQTPPSAGFGASGPEEFRADLPPAGFENAPQAGQGLPDGLNAGQEIAP